MGESDFSRWYGEGWNAAIETCAEQIVALVGLTKLADFLRTLKEPGRSDTSSPEDRKERHRTKARVRARSVRTQGGCNRCGIEVTNGKSLCTPCGRKNSRRVLERLVEKKAATPSNGTGEG